MDMNGTTIENERTTMEMKGKEINGHERKGKEMEGNDKG